MAGEVTLLAAAADRTGTLQVCLALFAALLAAQLFLAYQRELWRPLVLGTFLGMGLCLADLALDLQWLFTAALVLAAGLLIATAAPLLDEMDLLPRSWALKRWSPRRGPVSTAALGIGLLLLIGCGATVAILLATRGGGRAPIAMVVSGRYRVSGTCANGACTVNECTEPAPCGVKNHGRLREGAPVDIVCQTEGETVTAPDLKHSRIWDRLPSGLYISDLFVEGTVAGRFTRHLHHCSSA